MDSLFKRLICAGMLFFGCLFALSAKAERQHFPPEFPPGTFTASEMCASWASNWGGSFLSPYATCTGGFAGETHGGTLYRSVYVVHSNVDYESFFSECPNPGEVVIEGECAIPEEEEEPEDCEALSNNPDFITGLTVTFNFESRCIGGCTFGTDGAHVNVAFGGETFTTGEFKFTGESCPDAPDQPPKETVKPENIPPQQCKVAANGQTFCVKNNGEQCYSATTGKQICWQPTETGKKYDDSTIQQRVAGSDPGTAPPDTTISSTPTTTTTTSSTTNVTNTTTNYTTNDGSSPGTSNDAEPTSPGTSATGGTCDASYICSGDGIACASLEEQRKTRCAVENANKGITGGATCGDVPVCAGTNCNASAYHVVLQAYHTRCAAASLAAKADSTNSKLDALTAAVNGIETGSSAVVGVFQSDGELDGDDDAAAGEGGTAAGNDHNGEIEYGEGGLDTDGMGFDRSCPVVAFDFNGAHYQPDMFWVCTGFEIESYIFLLIVAFFCLRYIGGA